MILNWQPLREPTKILSGSGMTEFSKIQAQSMSLQEKKNKQKKGNQRNPEPVLNLNSQAGSVMEASSSRLQGHFAQTMADHWGSEKPDPNRAENKEATNERSV